MERGARVLVLSGVLLVALGTMTPPAHAKLYRTREAALRNVFGAAARLEARTVWLTAAQVDSVRHVARAPFDAPRLTYYAASRGDTLLGYAFLDTHPVRTMSETLLIAVDPAGRVLAAEILAFHEPEDYLPPPRWLQTLLGRRLSPHLRPGDQVDGISGATLSARAATEAVRRALGLHHVLHGKGP